MACLQSATECQSVFSRESCSGREAGSSHLVVDDLTSLFEVDGKDRLTAVQSNQRHARRGSQLAFVMTYS